MSDTQGGETIRSMVSGFNAMQAQLGLLPVQGGSQPLGVSLPPPPPPPPVYSPGEMAIQASQLMQSQAQQTVQAAQMTRYTPPPSSPPMGGGGMPMGGGMGGGMGMNPYLAQALGGGGGGGMGMGMGMPHPMMMTAPNMGGYRPMGAAAMPYLNPGHTPSPLNPMAVTPPNPMFSQPYQHDYRLMQGNASAMGGYAASKFEGGLGMAGSLIGGIAGSAFGPLGSIAGSYIGGRVLPAIGGLLTGSAMSDMSHGRRIQNMTAPYMVGGPMLNPFTGQGMQREEARDTARGIRRMTRDHQFERQTGFNTSDIRNITQVASDQGMLETAQGSEDILRKVKAISKSVKVLMQVSGDPDVKAAIASLGKMKNLGFEGLSGQLGAAANTTAFARMAGLSTQGMQQQYGMPGAMMGQNLGMAGATGYQAGMMGGAQANMAVGAGTFTDLQKARAGGRQGIAQANMMAMLGAANQDTYMAAALRRDSSGELAIDASAYKKAQGMRFDDVARMAQNNMNQIGREGIEALSTRKQEFKDQLAQKMGPFGMQMNYERQIRGLQEVTGQTLGATIRTQLGSTKMGQGMSDEQRESMARTLELQMSDRGRYDAQIQQLEIEKRRAQDRQRALRSSHRTPGMMTRAGESIRDFTGGISDAVTGWSSRNIFEPLERIGEDRAAQGRGERVQRHRQIDLIRNDQERALVQATMMDKDFQGAYAQQGADPFNLDQEDSLQNVARGISGGALGSVGRAGNLGGLSALASGLGGRRMRNRVGNFFGFSAQSDENRVVTLASQTRGTFGGFHPFGSFGDVGDAIKRVRDVQVVGRGMDDATRLTVQKSVDQSRKMRKQGQAMGVKGFNSTEVLTAASNKLISEARHLKQGGGWHGQRSATAMSGTMLKDSFVQAATSAGSMSQSEAEAMYEANSEAINASMLADVRATGDRKLIETAEMAQETNLQMGGVSGAKSRDQVRSEAKDKLGEAGLRGISDKTLAKFGNMIMDRETDVVAMALAVVGAQTTKGREQQADTLADIRAEAAKRIKDPEKLDAYMAKVKREGAQLAEKMSSDKDVKWAAKKAAEEGGKGTKNMMETLAEVKEGIVWGKAATAQEHFQKKLSAEGGMQEGVVQADSPWEAMMNVDYTRLRKGSKKRILAEKMQKDDGSNRAALEKELGELVTSEGPTSTRGLLGGEGGDEVRRIEEQIQEIQQIRDKIKEKGGKASDEDLAIMQAESSTALAKAAENLNNAADKIGIVVTGQQYQGGQGM